MPSSKVRSAVRWKCIVLRRRFPARCAPAGEVAAAKLREIAQLPIEIVGVDMELGKLAASLKAQHSLPYADCFAAAVAQLKKAPLVTADGVFSSVETILKIVWIY